MDRESVAYTIESVGLDHIVLTIGYYPREAFLGASSITYLGWLDIQVRNPAIGILFTSTALNIRA